MSSGFEDDNNDEKIQVLGTLLESRLPALGLDFETYGPYILPLLHYHPTTNNTALILDVSNEDDEEWDDVLELLRASSETHGDDQQSFCELRSDIIKLWNRHLLERMEKLKEQNEMKLKELSDQLVRDGQLAQAAAALELEKKDIEGQRKASSSKDEATKALIERYGYADNDSDEEHPGTKGSGNAKNKTELSSEEVVLSNKEYAAMQEKEKAQELRSKKTVTKREEQQKTKESTKLKEEAKEERRKRAIKGERKR